MEIFAENLRDFILKTGKSLRKISQESGVSAMQYSRYQNGSIPTIDITLKIAKYFNCTLDYLFGLCDNNNFSKYKTYDYNISIFLVRYKQLLAENNISHYKFMKTSEFDESVIRHWENGSKPRLDIIYYIAKNLSGSMDDLIGRH